MRKITVLCVFAIIICIPHILKAQHNDLKKEITITTRKLSGHELLDELTKITEHKFFYSESIIRIPSKIELYKTKGSLLYFLDKIFEGQDVEYIIKDYNIMIKPKAKTKKQKKPSIIVDEKIKIKGKIIDAETNRAIPYANIAVCNQSIGLASNENGEFIIKIPNTFKDSNLCINVIGYNNYSQKISSFQEELLYIIKLEPKIYDLAEVIIKEKKRKKFNNPEKIVKLAINNIENNYPLQPFNLQGYYREYLKYNNKNYLNLLEAAVVVKDKGFTSDFFPYRAQMLQMRYNHNFDIKKDFQKAYNHKISQNGNSKYIPNYIMPSFGGNELSILFAHNSIRRYNNISYTNVNQFNKNFISNHNFILDSIIYSEDIPLYIISFSYSNNLEHKATNVHKVNSYNLEYRNDNESKKDYNIRGKIIIRSNTWAIERFEYCSYSTSDLKRKNYEVIVNYKNLNGKMYLNYLTFSNYFKVLINPQTSKIFNIPQEEQPFIVRDIIVDGDSLILKFNRKIRKLSCRKIENFKFNGFVIKNNENNQQKLDTIYLQKHPNEVTINSNSIKLFMPNIRYLLTDLAKTDIKITGSNILDDEQASITNNKIKMGNISLTINKLKDIYGNKLNKLYSIDIYQ